MEKKEAIKILKDFHDNLAVFSIRTALETLHPELKESEDWIPKEIIKYLKEKGDFRSCWIAWLERQGEKESIVLKFREGDVIEYKSKQWTIIGVDLDNHCYDLSNDECVDFDTAHYAFKLVEQKPATDFSDLRTWKYIVDAVLTEKEGIGQYLDSPFTEEVAKKLQKRFGNIEQKSTDKATSTTFSYITPNQKFFQWIYDRLIYVHNENPDVDYMRSLKERIEDMQNPFNYENATIVQKDFASIEPRYNIGDVLCDKSCTTLNKDAQPNFEIVDIKDGLYICDKGSIPISQQDEYELVAKKIEQKPIDKVESKFKVGDFIVNDYCMGRIVEITNDAYLLDTEQGIPFSCHSTRLWDITKDAKDGDVLADGNLPFIFKKIDTNKCSYAYCGISVDDDFKIESDGESGEWTWMQDITPATKEQRNLLFQKMHNAGYEWDSEKKELKKIEQKSNNNQFTPEQASVLDSHIDKFVEHNPAWSEEDENHFKSILSTIECCKVQYPNAQAVVEAYNADAKWLKSLKERVGCEDSKKQGEQKVEEIDEEYKIGKWFTGLIPCWINAPSTLQPEHSNHGKNVVAVHLKGGGYRCCCVDDKKPITFSVAENTPFVEGWHNRESSAWSEEDKKTLERVIRCIENHDYMNVNDIHWLKSLKDRCTWKPSDKQMKALNALNVIGGISYTGQGQVLIELYKDLLKLKA